MIRVKLCIYIDDCKAIFGELYNKHYIVRNYKESWNGKDATFYVDFLTETEMFRVISELNSKCRSCRGLVILKKETLHG